MMLHLILILAFKVIFPLAIPAPCQRSCGDLEVPYPFGLLEDGPGCYFNQTYAVNCSRNGTLLFLSWVSGTFDIQITDISLAHHEMRILTDVSHVCYSASGDETTRSLTFQASMFPISTTKSVFTVIGCDIYAVFQDLFDDKDDYARGCLTICPSKLSGVVNGSCLGNNGCCQTDIPKNTYGFVITVSSYKNHTDVIDFNNCSYAFVAANDSFDFSTTFLSNFNYNEVSAVLDWSVGDGTCEEVMMNKTSYMCKGNSSCFDVDNGTGYRCRCWEGYEGNPYLSGKDGCQDIDECITNPCIENAKCTNTIGNFTCSCPKGYHGDGRKNGTRCSNIKKSSNKKKLPIKDIALGVSISIYFFLLLFFWLCWRVKQRKMLMQREKFFQQNGGLMLQRLLAEHKGSIETTTVFTDGQLKKATNNYHESTILGHGGHGTVYKGELNGKTVAVKKSKLVDQTQVKEFINEVLVLTQINHKNVVKLIGCCLETEVPLLVYEFITNGTLFDHIHNVSYQVHLSWRSRLHIAAETAGALSYLHSDATTQIIHRDIKTANILLDDNFTAKVSDFGASRLVPVDETQVTTIVQGTLGYLDPEYLNEMELTNKSDVYSFGVVLAELLTGVKALSFARPENERNLSVYFVSKYKEGNLFEIIDKRIFVDNYVEEIIEVAKLTARCLQMRGEERPCMKEVSMELEGLIRATKRHSWEEHNHDEIEHLLNEEVTI